MKITLNKPLREAQNIGKTIEQHLNAIGIFSLADLYEMTPRLAYERIRAANPEKTMPVCYYLYSLRGALVDLKWTDPRLKNMRF